MPKRKNRGPRIIQDPVRPRLTLEQHLEKAENGDYDSTLYLARLVADCIDAGLIIKDPPEAFRFISDCLRKVSYYDDPREVFNCANGERKRVEKRVKKQGVMFQSLKKHLAFFGKYDPAMDEASKETGINRRKLQSFYAESPHLRRILGDRRKDRKKRDT